VKSRDRVVAILCATLLLAGCGAVLKEDESAWCREHPERVVAASYTIGSPLLPGEAQVEATAEIPSPEYVRACRSAYQDR